MFQQDQVRPQNRHDRTRPYAAIVGSSNFTGPGLAPKAQRVQDLQRGGMMFRVAGLADGEVGTLEEHLARML